MINNTPENLDNCLVFCASARTGEDGVRELCVQQLCTGPIVVKDTVWIVGVDGEFPRILESRTCPAALTKEGLTYSPSEWYQKDFDDGTSAKTIDRKTFSQGELREIATLNFDE